MKFSLVCLALLPAQLALAEPSLDEIVQRARALADKKPQHVTCNMSLEMQIFDGGGKLEHHEEREATTTVEGERADLQTTRAVRDGKPLSDAELQHERQQADKAKRAGKKSGVELELSPLSSKNADGEQFTLLRKEPLWGHDAYVLSVKAKRSGPTLADGTVWIDAATFVELKGELVPSQLPDHADWVRVQEQFALSNGFALPTYVKVAGAGHFLLFKKGFASTMKWSACH